jgi:type II secretory pathway pseudopilin PulG
MTKASTPVRGRGHLQPALTLVEAVVSLAIVGVMLVAALNTVGAALATQKKMGDRGRAMLLAQDLMSEIVRQAYEDPDLSTGSFGLTADEVGDGSRSLWDDVDDYDGWSASPPQQRDGTVLSDFDGWRRSVAVGWVDSAEVATELGSDTGVKRITVAVTFKGLPLATLVALRTNTWQYGPEQE